MRQSGTSSVSPQPDLWLSFETGNVTRLSLPSLSEDLARVPGAGWDGAKPIYLR